MVEAMQYKFSKVRMNISPSEKAGVELLRSPSSLVATNSNFFGLGRKTCVAPCWLVTYNRPSASMIEPQ